MRVNFKDGGYADVPFTVDTTTSTDTDASNSQNSTAGTQNNAAGTQNTTTTANNTRSPQTGDSTSSMTVVFLMLAAACGTAVCQISRKKVR